MKSIFKIIKKKIIYCCLYWDKILYILCWPLKVTELKRITMNSWPHVSTSQVLQLWTVTGDGEGMQARASSMGSNIWQHSYTPISTVPFYGIKKMHCDYRRLKDFQRREGWINGFENNYSSFQYYLFFKLFYIPEFLPSCLFVYHKLAWYPWRPE